MCKNADEKSQISILYKIKVFRKSIKQKILNCNTALQDPWSKQYNADWSLDFNTFYIESSGKANVTKTRLTDL